MDRQNTSRTLLTPALQELAQSALCAAFLSCQQQEFCSHPFTQWFRKQPNCAAALASFKKAKIVSSDAEYQFLRVVADSLDQFLNYEPMKFRAERVRDTQMIQRLAIRLLSELDGRRFLTDRASEGVFLGNLEKLSTARTKHPLNPSKDHPKAPRQQFIRNCAEGFYTQFGHAFPVAVTHLTCMIDPAIAQRLVDAEIAKFRAYLKTMQSAEAAL